MVYFILQTVLNMKVFGVKIKKMVQQYLQTSLDLSNIILSKRIN